MDMNAALTVLVTAASTLAVAWLGHTAASVALSKALQVLVNDLKQGISLQNIAKDAADAQEVAADVKAVLTDK